MGGNRLLVLAFIFASALLVLSSVLSIDVSKIENKQPQQPLLSSKRPVVQLLSGRSFQVDYENNEFLKDGLPFRYVAGSLHYFRVPRAYWRDRIRKLKAAGLNALSMYVEWSLHEPQRGQYNFEGEADLEYFLKLTAEEELLVLLRPGPYVCAERDLGGLPAWLLNINPKMKLRTSDESYQREVQRWFDVLMRKMKPLLYGNGGNIIMVQVENEFGSYKTCDMVHLAWLRDILKSYVGNAALLYSTDGGYSSFLKCGAIPGVYATVDFGTKANVENSFAAMRQYEPWGPLVNSEFYPGWLSHWEERMATVSTADVVATMEKMLLLNASFSFYMFHGGTNFGFTSGANAMSSSEYQPQLTSYDYDAPLNEAGDVTPKYFAIREVLGKYMELPNIEVPPVALKGNYGRVNLKPAFSLFDAAAKDLIQDRTFRVSSYTPTFEELNQRYGFILYETFVPNNIPDPAVLSISDLRDRATIYLDQRLVGVLSRARQIDSVPLIAASGQKLSILVENQGRINFGEYLCDLKGILSPPLLSGRVLRFWNVTGLPFEKIKWIHKVDVTESNTVYPPAFYVGHFTLPIGEQPMDTYLDLSGWGKGVAYVNDFNLGRYWPATGPQVTLYVPGCYLHPYPDVNTITLFEVEYTPPPSLLHAQFVPTPVLNITPPLLMA